MKIDAFVQLIKNLSTNSIDDVDPNNTVLQEYTTPFDTMSFDDSVRVMKSGIFVWGDGSTYSALDSNLQSFQAPSCGWLWGAGGRWTDGTSSGYGGTDTAGGG